MFSSKFSNKCKQAAKCIRARVEPITKKKQATLRILTKDVADLLAAGQDDKAFGRVDALISETNHTSCYDTIEKCCEYILRQLPSLEKQRECSPEVMEVMGTLVFAAARFPDLPELCDLRRVFMERYGGDMQSSANAEFVEKLQKKTFSKEKKLQLMQSIAKEFSIRWNSQMFGQKLSNPQASKSDPSKQVVPSSADNKPSTIASQNHEVIPSRDEIEHTPTRLPRRQQIPEEAKVVRTASQDTPLHDPEKKKSRVGINEPESVEQYASHPKVPPYANARSSYNVTHKEDEPKDVIQHTKRPKDHDELDFVDEDKQRLGKGRYLNDKPAKSVPPYTKSSGNKNDYNIEGAKGNAMPPYAKADETKNVYAVKENIENMLENVELSHHEQRSDPRQGSRSVQTASNNVRAANRIPPYVKMAKEVVQEDSLVRSSNAAHDSSKNIEDTDDKINGYHVDKPKPYSVRRNFRSLPATGTANMPINEEKSSNYEYGGGTRPTNKQSATVYDIERNYDQKITRRNSTPEPNEDEMANVVGNGIPMPRTSRTQKKEGNKHFADLYDGKHDETDMDHEKPRYHATGGRSKIERNNSDHDEQKTTNKISRQPLSDDEKDNAIDYGNLFARTSNGRSRRGSRHPTAAYDDEELTMDRLLMHYSRKGKEEHMGKERRKRDLGANESEHPRDNAANGVGHPSNGEVPPSRRRGINHPPERALSVPPEPVSPEAIKTPARTVSMQPDLLAANCGRVHPKLPDFDNLAARLAALRNL